MIGTKSHYKNEKLEGKETDAIKLKLLHRISIYNHTPWRKEFWEGEN